MPRTSWVVAGSLALACARSDAPVAPVPPVGPGPALRALQAAGMPLGSAPLLTPPTNLSTHGFRSTGIEVPPGVPVRVTVEGFLTFMVNPARLQIPCIGPISQLPGGLNVVGPAGFAMIGNQPFAVQVGLGRDGGQPSSLLALQPRDAGAAQVTGYAQGPGIVWYSRPVPVGGAIGCLIDEAWYSADDYQVTGQQTLSVEALDPAVITPDRDRVSPGDTVRAELTVPWTSNFFLLQGWQWVPEEGGSSTTRFIEGCTRFHTFCRLEVRERGHLRVNDIVAEGAVFLTALSPVIEVITDTLKLELQLSQHSVQPVLAPCFDAVLQTAYGIIPRPQRQPGQHPCDPAGARTRAMRSDWVNVSVRAYFSPSGRPADGGALTLTAVVQPGGGGHMHGLGSFARPVGTFLQAGQDVSADGRPSGFEGFLSLTLSESGEAQAVYRTSGVSGSERIRATVASRGQQAADTDSVAIRIDALQELAAGGNIARIGIRAEHPQSHWGSGGMAAALAQLADALASLARTIELLPPPGQSAFGRFPGILGVNDMSLPRGGLFDIETEWANPHMLHRQGLDADVDVRQGSDDDFYARAVLVIWVARMGHTLTDERAALNHYHLTF